MTKGLSFPILSIVAVLLFVAAAPMPYGFYTFVKIIACGCAGIIFYHLWDDEYRGSWLWIWGAIAVLFNPIANIHMTKEIWMVADIITGLIFSFAAYKEFNNRKADPNG